MPDSDSSSIKRILEERAAERGVTLEELLKADAEAFSNSKHERKDCPDPHFLQRLDKDLLRLIAHMMACPSCKGMMLMIDFPKPREPTEGKPT